MDQKKGFFASLFDLSFSSFVTGRVIKVLYALSILGIGILALYMIIIAFMLSAGTGVLMLLIGGPLFFLLGVIASRVYLELILVIFRMGEDMSKMAKG